MGFWSRWFPSRDAKIARKIARAQRLIEQHEYDEARATLVGVEGEEAERLYDEAQRRRYAPERRDAPEGNVSEPGFAALSEERLGEVFATLSMDARAAVSTLTLRLFAGERLGRLSSKSVQFAADGSSLGSAGGPVAKRKVAEGVFAVLLSGPRGVAVAIARSGLNTVVRGATESEVFAFALGNTLLRGPPPTVETSNPGMKVIRGPYASTFALRAEQFFDEPSEHGLLILMPTQDAFAAMKVPPGVTASAMGISPRQVAGSSTMGAPNR
jgi:hypothetical protein